MDLLTDLLQQAGLHRRLLDLRHLAPGAALRFPCDRSIGLHVVRQGPVYLHADSAGGTLVLGSVLLAVLIAVPLATGAARYRGRLADHAIRLISTIGLGLPAFWLGIMVILLFSISLHWFPVSGYGSDWGERLHHLFLPCLTVALALSAVLTRNLRASLLMELQNDYVTAARARGLSENHIFWRHVMPNSLIPTINLLAVNIGWLIGGTVVIESVFAIPGLGQLLVKAIISRDYMVVQGVVLVFALATVAVNLLADLLTVALDPRVKL
jgi:peptide/nickel transport system permease protein